MDKMETIELTNPTLTEIVGFLLQLSDNEQNYLEAFYQNGTYHVHLTKVVNDHKDYKHAP